MAHTSAKAEELAKVSLDSSLPDLQHRLDLVDFWCITSGARVWELDCGQGVCITVLADAVGPDRHVDAVDPGPPDYRIQYVVVVL